MDKQQCNYENVKVDGGIFVQSSLRFFTFLTNLFEYLGGRCDSQ